MDDDVHGNQADPHEPTGTGTGAQVAGSALAGLLGVAAGGGGFGSVVVAAATPPLIELVGRVWDEFSTLRQGNVVGVVKQASDHLDIEPDALVEMANGSASGRQLLADAMFAAAATIDSKKVAALAKAMANGLMDDQAAVDESLMVVHALGDLEPPHVRLLGSLPAGGRGSTLRDVDLALVAVLQRNGLANDDAHARAFQADEDRTKAMEKLVDGAFTALERGKKLPRIKAKDPTGTRASRAAPRWTRTPFGSRCLEYLAAADDGIAESPAEQTLGRDGRPNPRGDDVE